MSTHTTRVTVGKQSAEAIAAAWRAELAKVAVSSEKRPSGPGWIERGELFASLKMGNVQFLRFLRERIQAGRAERFTGTCLRGRRVVRRCWYRLK